MNHPFFEKQNVPTYEERLAAGKALRTHVPRSVHATWSLPPEHPDPIDLLEESNSSRIAHLVPIRYGRMKTSPFAFLRGSAVIMSSDLATTPISGLNVQVCGDAHLNNFGTYATPERQQVFDVNDFDETLPGPWEWDVKRLATSVIVASRHKGMNVGVGRQAARRCVQVYRQQMWVFGAMRFLDVWYSNVDVNSTLSRVHFSTHRYITHAIEKARKRTSVDVFPKLTTKVRGHYRIKDDPPLLMHMEDAPLAQQLEVLLNGYIASMPDDRQVLLSRYHIVDIAQKVVGVGSVGTRCFIALLLGRDSTDPLFLQIKEAQTSVLERYLGPSQYPNHAQRVVCGQQLIQGASDIFLGWTSSGSTDYYIRQLRDRSLSPNIETMRVSDFITYAGICGWVLARAHARSGDAAQISGYLGKSDVFDQAIASFAETYANQVERDYAALVAAVQTGRLSVKGGV